MFAGTEFPVNTLQETELNNDWKLTTFTALFAVTQQKQRPTTVTCSYSLEHEFGRRNN